MKVIWESNLQIEKMCSSAERAILCQKSRGFKATIEKEEKHGKMLDAVAKGISDLLLGVLIFGGMAVALYFGSVRQENIKYFVQYLQCANSTAIL